MDFEWSDLRIFLAIARAGTLGGAARAIGQTQPTMGRRLRALERSLGHVLFQRTPDGLVLTDEGAILLEHAERIESETHAFSRRLEGHDNQLAGQLRLSSPEWFGTYVLAPVLAQFARHHPKVVVELVTDARLLSLSRRETDLAFRTARFDDPQVTSRHLMRIPYALYGTSRIDGSRLGDGTGIRLITMDSAFSQMPDVLWLKRKLPKAEVVFRSNNREVHAALCARGIGLAVLPRPLGDLIPGITPIDLGEPPPPKDMFVGYHRDLRRLPRLRALLDLVVDRLGTGA
jgi:DNA-binding transcriptional LysR family regulator